MIALWVEGGSITGAVFERILDRMCGKFEMTVCHRKFEMTVCHREFEMTVCHQKFAMTVCHGEFEMTVCHLNLKKDSV